jgi:hypothetical protein
MLIIGFILNTYTSVYLQMRKAELFPPKVSTTIVKLATLDSFSLPMQGAKL